MNDSRQVSAEEEVSTELTQVRMVVAREGQIRDAYEFVGFNKADVVVVSHEPVGNSSKAVCFKDEQVMGIIKSLGLCFLEEVDLSEQGDYFGWEDRDYSATRPVEVFHVNGMPSWRLQKALEEKFEEEGLRVVNPNYPDTSVPAD